MAVAFVAVVVVGRSFSARAVSAKTPTLSATEGISSTSRDQGTSKNLVTLIGAEHVVRVDTRAGTTVYTVCDRSGNVLAAELSKEQLGERFPSLRLEDLHAQDTTLMIADPRE